MDQDAVLEFKCMGEMDELAVDAITALAQEQPAGCEGLTFVPYLASARPTGRLAVPVQHWGTAGPETW